MGRNAVNSLEPGSTRALWLLIGLALLIRLWGICYGLPFIYWTDEYHEVMRALELGAGEFNLSRTGKGGFYFLLFFEYGIYYGALKVSGSSRLRGNSQNSLFVIRPCSTSWVEQRQHCVGCATVAAAYYCGAAGISDEGGSTLRRFFLPSTSLHIDLSHRVGVDVPMMLFASLALYFGLRIVAQGRRRDYVLAGLCAALATTTKLPGILVLLPLLIAHTYRVAETPGERMRWLTSRDFWLAVVDFRLGVGSLESRNPASL